MHFWQKTLRVLPIAGLILFLGLALYGIHMGIFKSPALLQQFISQFGEWAVLAFILIQIIQVLVPVLPGGISSVAGMLMFGNIYGLLYSYIGLVIGEIAGFLLIRHYGKRFAEKLLSPKRYLEFNNLLEKNDKNIKKIMIGTLLIPFAPDDLVCLVAGMTNMSFKQFLQILLLLKPWSIGVYSYILVYLFEKGISL